MRHLLLERESPILAFSFGENNITLQAQSCVSKDRGGHVPNRIATTAAAVLAVLALAACSPRSSGQIASTASVSVNGNSSDIHVVRCTQLEWYRTIYIGSDFAGATVIIDQRAQPLSAESVRIQNLGGFTGLYSAHDGGDASTSLSGDKFSITGTANGYKTDKPSEPATATFKITATC
jgi:hypothetical protein